MGKLLIPIDKRNHDTRKASESRKRKVVMISYKGSEQVFQSIKDAANATGLYESAICRCCRGNLKYTGGFRFKYLNENKNGYNNKN